MRHGATATVEKNSGGEVSFPIRDLFQRIDTRLDGIGTAIQAKIDRSEFDKLAALLTAFQEAIRNDVKAACDRIGALEKGAATNAGVEAANLRIGDNERTGRQQWAAIIIGGFLNLIGIGVAIAAIVMHKG